jgi:hypothetical protein
MSRSTHHVRTCFDLAADVAGLAGTDLQQFCHDNRHTMGQRHRLSRCGFRSVYDRDRRLKQHSTDGRYKCVQLENKFQEPHVFLHGIQLQCEWTGRTLSVPWAQAHVSHRASWPSLDDCRMGDAGLTFVRKM